MFSSQCAVETDSKTDNTDRLPSPTTAAEFQVPSPTLYSFEVIQSINQSINQSQF